LNTSDSKHNIPTYITITKLHVCRVRYSSYGYDPFKAFFLLYEKEYIKAILNSVFLRVCRWKVLIFISKAENKAKLKTKRVAIRQHVLDTNAGKKLSYAATDV
jgi:hypothetical protein